MPIKASLKRWLNASTPDYNEGKNVMTRPNPLYVATIKQLIEEGRTVEFPVRGWSMRIFVEHERDKAILTSCNRDALKKGDVVLAHIGNNNFALHRIIAIDTDIITMMGDGNVKGTETCSRADVIAIVKAFRRKGQQKLDYVTSWKWRIYSRIWVTLLPIRRQLILSWRILRRLHIVS